MADRRSSPIVGLAVRNKVLPQSLTLIKSSLLQGRPSWYFFLCATPSFNPLLCLLIFSRYTQVVDALDVHVEELAVWGCYVSEGGVVQHLIESALQGPLNINGPTLYCPCGIRIFDTFFACGSQFLNLMSRGFGFVSFWNQQSTDAKSVVELTNGSSYGKETTNSDAPKINPQYTTVYGNLAPKLQVSQLDLHRHFHVLGAGVIEEARVQCDKGFGFMRFNTHAKATLAIQMGNTQLLLCGRQIKCSWGSKPTPPGIISNLLPPPQQLAMSKMGGVHALMHPQGQHLKQATMGMGMGAGASQAIYDGGYQSVVVAQQLMYYK
ncbi:hypothetical protein UlMin_041650 [Ulmus minor]